MRIRGINLLVCVALLVSGCSGQQGLFQSAASRVTLATSHQAYLLQAEVAMMFLSYVAVETGDRTPAQAVAAVSALNEAALAIDCIRGDSLRSRWAQDKEKEKNKDWDANCGNPGDSEFFYTKLLTVARSLLALARASLPDASLGSLLAALPQASANPLALVSPLLGVARDAVIVLPRGAAAYLDYRDIIVTSYCLQPPSKGADCASEAVQMLRDDATLGQRILISPQSFDAARGLSKINCGQLAKRATSSTSAVAIDCKLGIPNA